MATTFWLSVELISAIVLLKFRSALPHLAPPHADRTRMRLAKVAFPGPVRGYQEAIPMRISSTILLAFCAALLLCVFSPVAKATNWNEKTILTFHQPVEIPGHVLLPGTYTFKLMNSGGERNIVEISSTDSQKVVAIVLTDPVFQRYVEVHANKNALATQIEVLNRELVHFVLPFLVFLQRRFWIISPHGVSRTARLGRLALQRQALASER